MTTKEEILKETGEKIRDYISEIKKGIDRDEPIDVIEDSNHLFVIFQDAITLAFEEKDKEKAEQVKKLKEETQIGVKLAIKLYLHKSGEELASEISYYLTTKVYPKIFGSSGEETG